jgi:signal peptidase I
MTLLHSNGREPHPLQHDGPPDASPARPDIATTNHATTATSATTSRSRRGDYRLRGLDLGAQRVAERPPQPLPKHQPSRRRRRRLIIKWILALTVAACVAVVLRAEVVEPFLVTSPSMVPTMQVGDRILVVRSNVLPRALKFGDIVVFHQPQSATCGVGGDHKQDLVKRVIGLPGERIWSVGDTIYVDGHQLNEPGWWNPPYGHLGPTPIIVTTIPPGQYFVMGDNRTDTCDSRSFGPIRDSSIVGKVVADVLRHGHPHVHLF